MAGAAVALPSGGRVGAQKALRTSRLARKTATNARAHRPKFNLLSRIPPAKSREAMGWWLILFMGCQPRTRFFLAQCGCLKQAQSFSLQFGRPVSSLPKS